MKKFLTLALFSILVLSALTGCNRSLRRDSNSQQPDQPTQAVQPAVTQPTSAPALEATATQLAATEVPTVQPTDTVVPTVAISQSDIVADQLDALLGQFNSELQTVDTIPETP
ncbi:MAG: hypothetical protein JNM55_22450 [Anaerolineales bacterium]|nr:hypothetical protein [Anaerolineales bacterium]